MRPLRSGPEGQLYELNTKTLHDQYVLRPSAKVNCVIKGCMARAQLIFPVDIHAFVYMSNHYHMLVTAQSAQRLSAFMCHLNSNIARELNRLLQREGKVWRRRFRSVPVSLETRAQMARLRYILSHGVKERLVRKCKDWPGASSLPWLAEGKPLRGKWQDRTREYEVNRRLPKGQRVDIFIEYTIRMTPLPCWVHEEMEAWQAQVRQMILEIEQEASSASERARKGPERGREFGTSGVLGRAAVLRTDPFDRPKTVSRSPAPMYHAADKEEGRRMREAIAATRQWYAEASLRFRKGDHGVEFPPGTHRPMGMFSALPGVDDARIDAAQQPEVGKELRVLRSSRAAA